MNCAGVVTGTGADNGKVRNTSVRSKNSPQAGNFCKSQAGMKTTTTTIWLPWRCSTSTITFDHKSNYLPFTHVDSIRAIETKRVENDVSILIDKKINCLGAALVIWLHQLTNNFFFTLMPIISQKTNFGFDISSYGYMSIDTLHPSWISKWQNFFMILCYSIHGYISLRISKNLNGPK